MDTFTFPNLTANIFQALGSIFNSGVGHLAELAIGVYLAFWLLKYLIDLMAGAHATVSPETSTAPDDEEIGYNTSARAGRRAVGRSVFEHNRKTALDIMHKKFEKTALGVKSKHISVDD